MCLRAGSDGTKRRWGKERSAARGVWVRRDGAVAVQVVVEGAAVHELGDLRRQREAGVRREREGGGCAYVVVHPGSL